MQERFSPAKYSQVLLAIAMAVQAMVAMMMNGLTPEGYGAIAGAMIFTLGFSMGVAYVVWRISGKRERPASIALSIVSGILILAPLAAYLTPLLLPSRRDRDMSGSSERVRLQVEADVSRRIVVARGIAHPPRVAEVQEGEVLILPITEYVQVLPQTAEE